MVTKKVICDGCKGSIVINGFEVKLNGSAIVIDRVSKDNMDESHAHFCGTRCLLTRVSNHLAAMNTDSSNGGNGYSAKIVQFVGGVECQKH